MTRKEQIETEAMDNFMYANSPLPPAAIELFDIKTKAFCQGAEWADANPPKHLKDYGYNCKIIFP